jgi:flagellar motor switch protein FliM
MMINLCYPFPLLEPILPLLTPRVSMKRSRMDAETLVLENRLRLGSMDLPVVVELGRTQVSLSEAESLQRGDIIRVPTRQTDPVVVYVGGKPKYLARPFATEDGEVKVKLIGTIS